MGSYPPHWGRQTRVIREQRDGAIGALVAGSWYRMLRLHVTNGVSDAAEFSIVAR